MNVVEAGRDNVRGKVTFSRPSPPSGAPTPFAAERVGEHNLPTPIGAGKRPPPPPLQPPPPEDDSESEEQRGRRRASLRIRLKNNGEGGRGGGGDGAGEDGAVQRRSVVLGEIADMMMTA